MQDLPGYEESNKSVEEFKESSKEEDPEEEESVLGNQPEDKITSEDDNEAL